MTGDLPQPLCAIARASGEPLDTDAVLEAVLPWVAGLCFLLAALIAALDPGRCEGDGSTDGATAAATLAPVMRTGRPATARQGRSPAQAAKPGDCRRSGRRMPG